MVYSLAGDLTQKLYELNLPSAEAKKFYVCVMNEKNQRVCFFTPRQDAIICEKGDDNSTIKKVCQLSLHTPREDLMDKLPKSIFTNVEPGEYGLERMFYYLGTFTKDKLQNVQETIGLPIKYEETDKINVSLGYKEPKKSCAWKIWDDECRSYIESDDYKLKATIKPPFLKYEKEFTQ